MMNFSELQHFMKSFPLVGLYIVCHTHMPRSRLQERQRLLLEEALILSGLEQRSASDPMLVVARWLNG